MSFDGKNKELKFISAFAPSMLVMLDGNISGEAQTGLRIFDQLRDKRDYGELKGFTLKRELISSREKLLQQLEILRSETRPGVGVILHLEFHGDKDGIEVGNDSERVDWPELMAILTEINVRSRCNLGLVLAGCDGLGSFKVDDMAKPVAFYFQLSHAGIINAGPLQNSLLKFYDILITSKNLQAAAEAAKPFQMKYAETIFADLMYRICRSQSPAALKKDFIETTLTNFLKVDGIRNTIDVTTARMAVKQEYKSYEEWIRRAIVMYLSFFCGRTPAYTVDQLTQWILDGETMI